MKRALITGTTGQDGSYLTELLIDKGYHVIGFSRRESWYRPNSASHLAGRIEMTDADSSRPATAAQSDEKVTRQR